MLYSDRLTFDSEFAVGLFVMMGVSSFLGFLAFKSLYEQQRINKLSDRAFVFAVLTLGMIGSMTLIDYKKRQVHSVQAMMGFCLLAMALHVGRRVTSNMFAKILGCSATNGQAKYITISVFLIAATRVAASFWNISVL